jgi:DNA polymerase III epsilon subunit-like protein
LEVPRRSRERRAEKLPGKYGRYKWPKLAELHQVLFGEPFEGAHGALADARACMRCYFRLTELGVAM